MVMKPVRSVYGAVAASIIAVAGCADAGVADHAVYGDTVAILHAVVDVTDLDGASVLVVDPRILPRRGQRDVPSPGTATHREMESSELIATLARVHPTVRLADRQPAAALRYLTFSEPIIDSSSATMFAVHVNEEDLYGWSAHYFLYTLSRSRGRWVVTNRESAYPLPSS
jgi:hypothetical protein